MSSTQQWPSQQTRKGREGKGYRGEKVRTDWFTGWLVLLMTVAAVAAVAVFLWPLGVQMLDGVALISDKLSGMQLASAVTK